MSTDPTHVDVRRIQPRVAGQFSTDTTFHEALDAVRFIALAAAGGDVEAALAVSTRRWERQREDLGLLSVLSSSALRKRFAVAWGVVLAVAFADPARRAYMLGTHKPAPSATEYDGDACLRALQAVARRLGRTPSKATFDEEVRRIEAERNRRRHAVTFLELPRSNAAQRVFGSWDAAIAAAGLPPLVHERPSRMSWEDVLDLFITTTGLLPTKNYLREWCRRQDIPQRKQTQPFAETIVEVWRRRAARGDATPAAMTPLKELPVLPPPPTTSVRRGRGPGTGKTREDILAALRLYAKRYLRPGEAPRAKHYQSVKGRDPELVAVSAFARHGRFQDLCREAGIG